MLQPKKTKWRKQQKGRLRGYALRGCNLSFGDFGLQAVESGMISSRQIEASRIAINRELKRGGKVWIRLFPDKPLTKKPLEVRMGKGKGPVDRWVSRVKCGRVLFEIEGVDIAVAKKALELARHKLPVKSKFVHREANREAK